MYIERKEFLKKIRRCDKTVTRFYNNNPELALECKRNKKMIPLSHYIYFDKENMIETIRDINHTNELLIHKYDKLKNLIDYSESNTCETTKWLLSLPWTYFMTVAYKDERSKVSCRKAMDIFFEKLNKDFGNSTELRLFYTTEPFTNRAGYHNHLVLYVGNEKLRTKILNKFNKLFRYDRTDYQDYDKYQSGILYVSKEGLQGEDWDIHHNEAKNKQIA